MKILRLRLNLLLMICVVFSGFESAAAEEYMAGQDVGVPLPLVSEAAQTPRSADECGCRSPAPDVLATVNGVKITRDEIDSQLKSEIEKLEQEVIKARKQALGLEINTRLLQAEAAKRGVTSEALLQQEVVAKAAPPTETEALTFYNENKAQIGQEFSAVKTEIIKYLTAQREKALAEQLAQQLRAVADLKILAVEATPPKTSSDRARVFAMLRNIPITSANIEDSLLPLIVDTQKKIFQWRGQKLSLRINDLLLEQEAQKRKLTTRALLDAELLPKTKIISEADARTFFDQNKEKLTGEFAQVKSELMQYLQEKEQRRSELAYAQQLRSAATVQIFLIAP
jgi:hypothetical protein